MSEEPLAPLPADLADLFEREGRAYVEDATAKAKVLHGVSRAVLFSLPAGIGHHGLAGAPPGLDAVRGAAALGTWTGAKVMALVGAAFLAGGVSGTVLARQWRTLPERQAPPMVETQTTATLTAPNPSSGAPDDSVVAVPVPAATAPSSSSSAPIHAMPSAGASSDRASTLAREREVLDAARAALSHGRWSEALTAVHEHETRWPRGALTEEREVLAIRALAASGQTVAACGRAARFRSGFPKSILSDVVSSALANSQCSEGPGR